MSAGKKPARFIIPSLLAAGFGAHDAANAAPLQPGVGDDNAGKGDALRPFSQDHFVTLAMHASHASHSSGGYSGGHASHASHSSGGYSTIPNHSSHLSHTSHRSSATYEPYDDGDVGIPPMTPTEPQPTPTPTPTVPHATPPSRASKLVEVPSPTPSPLPALSGRSQRFASIVKRVQIALLAQGFYEGPINGAVGPVTRGALRKFQSSRGLDATGTITPQTLDALKVGSE